MSETREVVHASKDREIQPSRVSWMTGVRTCPAPTPVFTGRQDKIDQIVDCISRGDKQRCVFVLYGLGGAGKTQLALNTVEHTKNMWTDVVFVDATSHETATGTLADFAKAKKIGDSHESAIRWLGTRSERWLMVIDNADDPLLNFNQYFPTGDAGSILITTRISGITMLTRGHKSDCKVSSMEGGEGLELLLRAAGMQEVEICEEERRAATQLLESFGYLALAIVQAGAYIRYSECTIRQYQDMFTKHHQVTLEKYNELPVKVDNYYKSVYTTWHMSYKLLSVNAQRLLHMMAFMHRDGIIEDVFRRAATYLPTNVPFIPETKVDKEIRAYVMECLQPYLDFTGTWDSGAFLSTMNELLFYSLISYDEANGTYTLHVLVQDWAKTVINYPMNIAIEHTTLLLAISIDWADTMENLEYNRVVEVHVNRVLELQPQPSANNARRFTELYRRSGKWKQHETMNQIVVDGCRRSLGEEHEQTLISMNNLSAAFQEQGRYEQAETLLVQLLEVRRRMSGDENHGTIIVMSNLATTYRGLGRYKEAELLQLQIMDANKRMSGEEHPDTLISIYLLALTYEAQSRYDEAEALLLQVVDARKRVSGDEHIETLRAMYSLAAMYYYQRRYAQAESMQVYVLEVRKRRLGGDHFHTLNGMNDLALTYCAQGRYGEAEALQVQLLDERKRTCGAEHMFTFTSMFNLAYTYRAQGHLEKAEELQLQAVEGYKRVIGERHPSTLNGMYALLTTYSQMGEKRQEELEILRRNIEALEAKAN